MGILVAGVAIGEGHICEALEGLSAAGFLLVAVGATHGSVFSGKRKLRFVMAELARRGKGIGRMATGAVVAQRFLVVILVAVEALCTKAEEGIASFFQVGVGDVVGLVTLATVNFPVRPGEFVTCQVVVEFFFIETHHPEITAVVVAVAGSAFFSPNIFRVVVALAGV